MGNVKYPFLSVSLCLARTHTHAQTQLQRIKEEELHNEKNLVQQVGVFSSSSSSPFVFKVYHQYHPQEAKEELFTPTGNNKYLGIFVGFILFQRLCSNSLKFSNLQKFS